MHLSDEHERLPAVRAMDLRGLDRLADVFHAREHSRQRNELGIERAGHEPRERGFADAGRAPENHRMRLAGLERDAQWFRRPEQMLLTDDVVDGARAQAFRERNGATVFFEHM